MASILLGISINVAQLVFVILTRRRDRISLGSILAMFLLSMALVIPVALLQNALMGGGSYSTITFGHGLLIAVTEELAKGCVIALFILRTWRRSDTGIDMADGIGCAIAVAAGAALVENLFSVVGGGDALMRALSGFGHMTYGVVIATGVVSGIAAAERGNRAQAAAYVLGGFVVACLLHAVWDSAFAVFYGLAFSIPGLIMFVPFASYLMYAYWIAVSAFGICYTAHQYRQRTGQRR